MIEKPLILVIDDEYLLVRLISDYLTRQGYEVKSTTSPREALAMIKNERFDIVVTDLRMEPVSGTAIIRQLRNSAFEGKIIVMSAFFTEFEKELRELKVDAFIEKPFDLDELHEVIMTCR